VKQVNYKYSHVNRLIKLLALFLALLLPGKLISQKLAKNTTTSQQKLSPTDKKEADEQQITLEPFEFNAVIQGGLLQNFSGGIKTGSDYMSRVHLTLSFDTEKAGLWKGGKLFINGTNAHGGTPTSTLIGDFQPISRNEATERTGLFELWYQQTIGNTSILIGQHDMNSSFGTSNYAGLSINSAFGMYPSITPNTGFAFSIFPRTMPAVYVKHEMKKFTIQAAAYSGASENFAEDRYNLKWNLDDSRFMVGEIHYKNIKNGIQKGLYKLGVINHSGDFINVTDLSGNTTAKAGTGLYVIADHLILQENENSDQGLGLFFEWGAAPGNHNLIDRFMAGGLVYKGLIRNRNEDKLFLGILSSSINNDIPEGSSYDQKARTIIELNYALRLGDHFTLQPDLQYIINPGATSAMKDAFLGVFRFSINF